MAVLEMAWCYGANFESSTRLLRAFCCRRYSDVQISLFWFDPDLLRVLLVREIHSDLFKGYIGALSSQRSAFVNHGAKGLEVGATLWLCRRYGMSATKLWSER